MWYNLITTYGSIKRIEEIFLNIIFEKKELTTQYQNPVMNVK